MFTVGYGDITPKNLAEITTIMFIQIIGKWKHMQELSTWAILSIKLAVFSPKLMKGKKYYIATYLQLKKWLMLINYQDNWLQGWEIILLITP